jgi:hypothetical protein
MAIYEVLRHELEQFGYLAGRVTGDSGLDRVTAAATTCEHCGRGALKFVPFRHADLPPARGGYIAVMACRRCGWAEEF